MSSDLRVFVHIGTNKTGTSAIQSYLAHNPIPGVLYPRTGRGDAPAHHELAKQLHTRPQRAAEFAHQLKSELSDSPATHTVIFSSEAFRVFDPAPLAAMLQDYSPQIVLYLRPHAAHLSSWWREGIKSRSLHSLFSNFVAHQGRPYYPWVKNWISIFGRDNVILERYNRDFDISYSSVANFFSKLSINYPQDIPIHEENPSISGNLLEIKRQVNQYLNETTAHALIPEVLHLAQLDPTFHGPLAIPASTQANIDSFALKYVQDFSQAFNFDLAPPPSPPTQPFLSPDLSRFEDDLASIYHHSQAQNFEIRHYIRKAFPRVN